MLSTELAGSLDRDHNPQTCRGFWESSATLAGAHWRLPGAEFAQRFRPRAHDIVIDRTDRQREKKTETNTDTDTDTRKSDQLPLSKSRREGAKRSNWRHTATLCPTSQSENRKDRRRVAARRSPAEAGRQRNPRRKPCLLHMFQQVGGRRQRRTQRTVWRKQKKQQGGLRGSAGHPLSGTMASLNLRLKGHLRLFGHFCTHVEHFCTLVDKWREQRAPWRWQTPEKGAHCLKGQTTPQERTGGPVQIYQQQAATAHGRRTRAEPTGTDTQKELRLSQKQASNMEMCGLTAQEQQQEHD